MPKIMITNAQVNYGQNRQIYYCSHGPTGIVCEYAKQVKSTLTGLSTVICIGDHMFKGGRLIYPGDIKQFSRHTKIADTYCPLHKQDRE